MPNSFCFVELSVGLELLRKEDAKKMAPQQKKDLSKKTASAKKTTEQKTPLKKTSSKKSGKKTSSSKTTAPTRTAPKKMALISSTKKTAAKKETGAKSVFSMKKPLNKKAALTEKIAMKSGAKVKFYFSIANFKTQSTSGEGGWKEVCSKEGDLQECRGAHSKGDQQKPGQRAQVEESKTGCFL